MSLIYILIGVVIGTFIPMPQQEVVRSLASSAWSKIKGWLKLS